MKYRELTRAEAGRFALALSLLTYMFGILQIVADVLKLFGKHDWVPPFSR